MTFHTVRVWHVFCIYLYVASSHSMNWSEKISADDPEDQHQISLTAVKLVLHDPLSEARAHGSDTPPLQIEASLLIALTYCALVCISGFSAHNLNSCPRNLNTKMSVQCALSAKEHSVLGLRVFNSKDCKTKYRSQVKSTTGPVASRYVLMRTWLTTVDLGIQMKDSIIVKAHVSRQYLAYLTKHLENRRLEE